LRGRWDCRAKHASAFRFDLTRHELVAGAPGLRAVFHGYSDARDPAPAVLCYSLEEVLAEKIRALVERTGRARDVYDVVNVGRNFADRLDVGRARAFLAAKFAFKSLPHPAPAAIVSGIDAATLAADWTQALRHQLPVLPPVAEFLNSAW